jgi:hypothetical protein
VSRELDLLVAPFGGPVVARDQAGPVDATEVPVDERVPGLGLVLGTLGEPEVPFGVLLPGVRLQERVLRRRTRLNVTPIAVEDILAGVDQPPGARYGAVVDRVRGDSAYPQPVLLPHDEHV